MIQSIIDRSEAFANFNSLHVFPIGPTFSSVNGHSPPLKPLEIKVKHLSKAEIAVIKGRILRGDKYAEIASDYRINQGRIADLKFGRIFPDVPPASLEL